MKKIEKGSVITIEEGVETLTRVGYFVFYSNKEILVRSLGAGLAIGVGLGIAYELGKRVQRVKYNKLFGDFADKLCDELDKTIKKTPQN